MQESLLEAPKDLRHKGMIRSKLCVFECPSEDAHPN